MFGEATAHNRCQTCAALKLIEKNKLLEVERKHVPQCLIAGDANVSKLYRSTSEKIFFTVSSTHRFRHLGSNEKWPRQTVILAIVVK